MNIVERNTIKEAEAHNKSCPFRTDTENQNGFCIGGKCAAWRYLSGDEKDDSGYCGLGGRV